MRTYDDILGELAGIDTDASGAERLERALTICAFAPGLPGPDYASFKAWIIPKLISEHELLRRDPTFPLAITLKNAVFLRLIDASRALHDQGDNDCEPDVATFNKLKLLYSLHHDSERGQQVAQALMAKAPQQDLIDDLDNASPAELRLRLFATMGPDRAQDAAYIMGHLERATLDVGEHDFLHALSRFEAGDLAAAIRFSGRVPAGSIDAARAAYLAAKANAMLGETRAARKTLEKSGARLTTCQWLHLLELAAYNTDPAQAQAMVEGLMPASSLAINPIDNGYAEWAMFHVRVVVGALERLGEVADTLDASAPVGEAAVSKIDDEVINYDPVLKRARVALSFHATLSPDMPLSGGTQLLIPLINSGRCDAFRTWCEMQFRLGDYQFAARSVCAHLVERAPRGRARSRIDRPSLSGGAAARASARRGATRRAR